MSEDIFREIDEDLRAERMQKVWKRYGAYFIAGAVLIVAGVAGFGLWRDRDLAQRGQQGVQMFDALTQAERGDSAGAQAALALLAQEGSGGYALLARFNNAALKLRAGDVPGGAALLDQIAGDAKVDQVFRDLAVVQSVQAQIDTLEPATVEARLQPLLGDANAWRFSARELQALARIKAGKLAEAREVLTRLADDQATPSGIRARATELLQALGR